MQINLHFHDQARIKGATYLYKNTNIKHKIQPQKHHLKKLKNI